MAKRDFNNGDLIRNGFHFVGRFLHGASGPQPEFGTAYMNNHENGVMILLVDNKAVEAFKIEGEQMGSWITADLLAQPNTSANMNAALDDDKRVELYVLVTDLGAADIDGVYDAVLAQANLAWQDD